MQLYTHNVVCMVSVFVGVGFHRCSCVYIHSMYESNSVCFCLVLLCMMWLEWCLAECFFFFHRCSLVRIFCWVDIVNEERCWCSSGVTFSGYISGRHSGGNAARGHLLCLPSEGDGITGDELGHEVGVSSSHGIFLVVCLAVWQHNCPTAGVLTRR